jgi:hypothetical protein
MNEIQTRSQFTALGQLKFADRPPIKGLKDTSSEETS